MSGIGTGPQIVTLDALVRDELGTRRIHLGLTIARLRLRLAFAFLVSVFVFAGAPSVVVIVSATATTATLTLGCICLFFLRSGRVRTLSVGLKSGATSTSATLLLLLTFAFFVHRSGLAGICRVGRSLATIIGSALSSSAVFVCSTSLISALELRVLIVWIIRLGTSWARL
mmetsp:Transcript_4524/g.5596  ORF Transcript_4524/g.5596 Transcript_4524/m.5596 type:complete len:171 (-) Transcript_4524:68-580(-)